MSLKTPHILLVDGMSLMKTVPYGLLSLDHCYALAFMNGLVSYVTKNEVSTIFVVWEGGDGGRKNLYAPYKDSRKPSKETVVKDREALQLGLRYLGVNQIHAEGYEADDTIAYICQTIRGVHKVIYSGDTDFLQLVDPEVHVFQNPSSKGLTNLKGGTVPRSDGRMLITLQNFIDATGFIDPQHYLRCKLIKGDATDRTPGVAGVGSGIVKDYLVGKDIPERKRELIEDFIRSPDFEINTKLISLLDAYQRVPKESLRLIPAETSKENTIDFLTELRFARLLGRLEEIWPHFEKAAPLADIPALS